MKQILIILLLALLSKVVISQDIKYYRSGTYTFDSDTITLDSLSIVNGSCIISDANGNLLNDSLFIINYGKAQIIKTTNSPKTFNISFRVFPYAFMAPYYHKSINLIAKAPEESQSEFLYEYRPYREEKTEERDELIRRGSISRSISVGNNQNAVMNSSLNLQLSGKLSDDLNIKAAITDNNIPIQPEGTTQQIQDFDKVYMSVYNDRLSITGGDYEVLSNNGYFLRLNRKVRGGMINANIYENKEKKQLVKTNLSGAVSRGKYHRYFIEPIEGNQGPYRLRGANNESFIIIIAGSEKVYIDGKLLQRGLDDDYTIDYNSGEITFMPKMLITKDKRILVEFEYSEQSYARFSVYNSNEFITANSNSWINIFNEQDSKHQSLQQDLSDDEKKILSNAGDNELLAIVPNVILDTVFRNDMVFYMMKDSLVNGIFYDSIFVYSTNPDSALYRLGFSYVGEGNGNYTQVKSSANGRVFKWLAPQNNIPSGDYEPIRVLISPKRKTVVSAGSDIKINSTTNLFIETAISNNDVNTFSKLDSEDNTGFASYAKIQKKFVLNDSANSEIIISGYNRFVSVSFDAADRFKDAEHERNWNLSRQEQKNHEMISGVELSYKKINSIFIKAGSDWMTRENDFNGFNQHFRFNYNKKGFKLNSTNNYLFSKQKIKETNFLRTHLNSSQKIWRFILGFEGSIEDNLWNNPSNDSLMHGSFRFIQAGPYMSLSDTSHYPIKISYVQRNDFQPLNNLMLIATEAKELNVNAGIQKNSNNNLISTFTWREVNYNNEFYLNQPEISTITGRAEHNLRLNKAVFTIQTFYETGSGMELKREFLYIEVAPGQGVYQWTDYNGNGIKELNEFEVAVFPDQAKYIRVFTPGNDYIRVFNNKAGQTFTINPERIWGSNKGIKKLISRFSNTMAYSFENKTTGIDLNQKLNPYNFTYADTSLISFNRNLRNTLFFNRTNQIFGADYLYQNINSQIMLMNGYDSRSIESHIIKSRWNITRYYNLSTELQIAKKDYESEFFSDRNYSISNNGIETTIAYQPSIKSRLSLSGKYNTKINTSGIEKSKSYSPTIEYRLSFSEAGQLSANFSFISINYKGNSFSPVAYEMLEGLLPGNNYVWNIQLIQNLSKSLQLNLNYNARKSEDNKIIHTGNVEVRAYF